MTVRTVRESNLSGGISTRPPTLRLEGQVSDAQNVVLRVSDGASRRNGSRHVSEIIGEDDTGERRIHVIDRDAQTKRVVLYGDGGFRVYDTAGVEFPVTITPAAAAYLAIGTPSASDLRLVSTLDTTFIVNTLAPTSTDETVVQFAVTASHKNYDIMTSRLPAADLEHHFAEEPASNQVFPSGNYQYRVEGQNNFASWERTTDPKSEFRNPFGSWTSSSINPLGFKVRFRREVRVNSTLTYTAATAQISKTGAFGTYTWQQGDEIEVTSSATALPRGYYPIVAKINNNTIEISRSGVLKSSDVAQNESEALASSVTDVSGAVSIGAITRAYVGTHNFASSPKSDFDDVALALQDAIRTNGANDPQRSDVIIQNMGSGKFRIVSPWRGVWSAVLALYRPPGESDALTKGPDRSFWFSSGTATAGSGTPTERTQFVGSRWVQEPAPGSSTSTLDPETMPVVLTPDPDTGAFTIDVFEWKPRLSGDEESNPLPDFFKESRRVSDILVHKDRLFLGGDNIVLASRTGDFGNFFIDNVSNPVDSDPIDTRLPGNQVAVVDYLVPFRQSVTVFARNGSQFQMNRPTVLSRDSVRFTEGAQIITAGVRPQPSGQRMYYLAKSGDGSRLMEDSFTDLEVSTEADDVSSHVIGLLGDNPRALTIAHNESTVFVLSSSGSVHTYRTQFVGPRKIQSAWCTWTTASDATIEDAAVLNGELVVLLKRAGGRVLEAIPVEPGETGLVTFPDTSPISPPFEIGVLGAPRIRADNNFVTSDLFADMRAMIESEFPASWRVLPDPVTAESLEGLVAVILQSVNHATNTSSDQSLSALTLDEQTALSDFVKTGGHVAVLSDNPLIASSATLKSMLFQSLSFPSGDAIAGEPSLFNLQGVAIPTASADQLAVGACGVATGWGFDILGHLPGTGTGQADARFVKIATFSSNNDIVIGYMPRGVYGAGAYLWIADTSMILTFGAGPGESSVSQIPLSDYKTILCNFLALSPAATAPSQPSSPTMSITLPSPRPVDHWFLSRGEFSGGVTTWAAPVAGAAPDTIITESGDEIVPDSVVGVTITAAGDFSSGPVVIGKVFPSEIELTRPFLRDDRGEALLDVSLQNVTITTRHAGTTGYSVTAESSNRVPRGRLFISLDPENGQMRTSIPGDADKQRVFIRSIGTRPMTIVGVEHQVDASRSP